MINKIKEYLTYRKNKKTTKRELVKMAAAALLAVKTFTDRLTTDQARVIEILQYMANLKPEDIQKILVHSMVETMDTDEKPEE